MNEFLQSRCLYNIASNFLIEAACDPVQFNSIYVCYVLYSLLRYRLSAIYLVCCSCLLEMMGEMNHTAAHDLTPPKNPPTKPAPDGTVDR